MKRLISIATILFLLALSACAMPQGNSGGQFGTIASETGPAAPNIGTVAPDTSTIVESDTTGGPALDTGAARSNGSPLVSSDLGPPLPNGPEANEQEPSDPFEPINTRVLTFNEKTDEWFVRPVVSGYSKVVPPPARDGIGRVFSNAAVIPRFANALFQFRLKQAETEAMRFGINSTLGLGGWYDRADEWFGLKQEDNDFGLTLAKYGVGEGPYLMLPILGPSSVRDVIGMAADGLMDPIDYVAPGSAVYYRYAAKALQAINARTQNRGLFEYLDTYSIDKYGAIQDAYLQRREKQEANVRASGLVRIRTSAEGSDF